MSRAFRRAVALACITSATVVAQQPPASAARQVTNAINDSPSLAPDGREMVYLAQVAGREQLMIRSLDGRHVRQLTFDPVNHEDPAWSPDGTQIAFVYLSADTERIAVIPVAGGPAELISPAGERAIHPDWSPDGRFLAYCTDDDLAPPRKNDADIKVIELTTRRIRVLITGGVNTYPVWSPDGRRIAFRRMLGQTNSEVFVADSDGTHVRNLTNSPAFDGWPAWSPDGRRIAFASNRDGDYQIYVMDVDGANPQRVAATTGRATAPKWSTDGRTLYFPICRRAGDGFDCEIFTAAAPARSR